MKNLNLSGKPLLILSLVFLLSCADEVRSDKMPVTANSEEALELYSKSMAAMDDVYLDTYLQLLEQAIGVEPDFFMANYQLAMHLKYYDEEKFTMLANNAINTGSELSDAEELLKKILISYLENPKADVIEIGQELVALYPNDERAYYQLAYIFIFNNDIDRQLATYKMALDIAENKAPIYNMLGYIYMTLERFDEAEGAFKKYLELKPDIPNAYDSQGDYFMAIDEYGMAYESYMKAYEIDSLWSYSKAMKAKELYDSLEK